MTQTDTQHVTAAKSEGYATEQTWLLNSDVGLTEAHIMTGRNKGQISRDSQSGRLPYFQNAEGHRRYKVSDLYQVYGFRTPKQQPAKQDKQQDTAADETAVELRLLRQQVQSQADTIRLLEKHTATLEQTITRLLPAPQPAAAIMPADRPDTAQPHPAPKSLWQRILNK